MADVAEGEARRVEVDGLPPLAVYRLDDQFYVSDDTCTHGDASLSEGMLHEDGRIECPFHTGSFCLRTGEALTSPASVPIRVYPVRLQDGDVCITTEEAP
jgi:nitrite reductase/ring-hydroxylating ferredoxin subunit